MTKTVKQVLIDARALLETGWVGGPPKVIQGEHCPVTAIEYAGGLEDLDYVKVRCTRLIFTELTTGIIPWNDAPGRAKEEVLALFDRAIAKAGS